MTERLQRRLAGTLCGVVLVVAFAAGCHQGDAPTEPPAERTTPTPTPSVQLAGTWSGRVEMRGVASEHFNATVTQNGRFLQAEWSLEAFGATRFQGTLDGRRLSGELSTEHAYRSACWIARDVTADATTNRITFAASGYCYLDPVPLSLELTR